MAKRDKTRHEAKKPKNTKDKKATHVVITPPMGGMPTMLREPIRNAVIVTGMTRPIPTSSLTLVL